MLLKRIYREFNIAFKVLTRVDNWMVYFMDYFGWSGSKPIILKIKDIKFQIRPNSVDRWIFTEDLVLDQYGFNKIDTEILRIVDLGAHIGTTTVGLLQYFPKAKVYAFEPNKDNFELLKENVLLNDLVKRVELFNSAVSGRLSKKLKLYTRHDSANFSSTIDSKDYVEVDNVEFGRLNKFLVKSGNLLKMDIEGGEYDLLVDKYIPLLKKFDYIVLEYHSVSSSCNIQYLKNFLSKHEFKYKVLGNNVMVLTK